MIVVLLALILFAILFPGVLRFLILSALALIGVLFVMEAGRAHAEEMPQIDVGQMCQKRFAAMPPSQPRNYALNSCVDKEQSAYDALKSEWGLATQKSQSYCLQRASKDMRFFNYDIIENCINSTLQVEENQGIRPHRFQP